MKKKIILSILLPVQIILINILALFPEFVEKYYSNGLYLYISEISRAIFGIFSFSIGDIIYFTLIFFIFRWLWINRKTWRTQHRGNFLSVISFLSVIYFLFQFLWGINYNRVPLREKMSIEKDYTLNELLAFTERMIQKTNEAHNLIEKNDSIKIVVPYSVSEIYKKSINGYSNLSEKYSFFEYKTESTKSSLLSTPLSYMGFGGYLNPFTNESQVNSNLPKYNYPTTTCHEMAHQIGYASESEANFIGYMASVHNDDIYFKYSAYSFALKYCFRNISKIDKNKAKALLPLVNAGVLKNFEESEQFKEEYQSFVETIFKSFYDKFLKFNNQEEGLETYSKFVGLLVNYYKEKEL